MLEHMAIVVTHMNQKLILRHTFKMSTYYAGIMLDAFLNLCSKLCWHNWSKPNPLPLPDKVQDRLAKLIVFSTLDLQSSFGNFRFLSRIEKKQPFAQAQDYQFCWMPFGLTGVPASLMNKILRGLLFSSTYIDYILVYSSDLVKHKEHSHQVSTIFKKLV